MASRTICSSQSNTSIEFESATAIQTAVRARLVRNARYPTAVDLPQAYISFVVNREQEQADHAQIEFDLEQAHNAPMISDSDDNDTVA